MNLFDIAIKNLNRRKAKMLFTVIGMLIGITTIVAVSTITDAMNVDLGDKFDQVGANIIIKPKSDELSLSYGGVAVSGVSIESGQLDSSVPERILKIANRDNIAAIAPKLITGTEVEGKSALIVGVNFIPELTLKSWWNIRTVSEPEGTNPPKDKTETTSERPRKKSLPKLESNDVILGKNAAARLAKNPGDKITINGQEFSVWGVIDLVGSTVDDSIHMDLGKVQEVFKLDGQLSFIEVAALCTSCPIEDIIMQVQAELPEAEVVAVREAVKAREDTVERFSVFAKGVGIIVLAIGSVVVLLTMMGSINERTREIGIFRAIGFRRSHVFLVILSEGIILSLIAGVLGYLMGMSLASILGPSIAQMEVKIAWDWFFGIQAIAIAVLVGLTASIIPAFRASKLDPAEALRHI